MCRTYTFLLNLFFTVLLLSPSLTCAQSQADSLTLLIREEKSPERKNALYLERAVAYGKNDSTLAFRDLNAAFDYYKKHRNSKGLVDVYIARGEFYFNHRNHQKSMHQDSLAIQLAEKINYKEGKAIAIGRLGWSHFVLKNLPQAETNLTKAIALEKQLEQRNYEREIDLYGLLGVVKRDVGKYDQSITLLEQAIGMGSGFKNKKPLIRVYSNYANSLDLISQHKKSIAQHLLAIQLAEKYSDTTWLMREYNNIAIVFMHMNEYDKAMDYYDKSFEIGLKKRDYSSMGLALMNKALLNRRKGAYTDNDSLYTNAIQYFDKAKNLYNKSLAHHNYGNFLIERKAYEKAEEHLIRALQLRKRSGSKSGVASTLSILGKLMIEQQRLSEAENYLSQVRSIYDEIGVNSQYLNDLNLYYKRLYLAKKDYKKAFEYQQKEMETTKKMYDESEKVNALKLQSEYELEKKDQILQLEKENQRRTKRYIFSIAGFIVLVLLLGLFILWQRRKQSRKIHQAELVQIRQQHRLSLADSLSRAEQEERRKIAGKLHDETNGILSIAKLNIDQLEEDVFIAGSDADKKLKATKKLLSEAGESIRNISHTLMPVALDKYGLKAGISELVTSINTSGKIKIEEIIEGLDSTKSWAPQLKLTIYRMVQEVFNNIIKHAQATHVLLQIVELEDTVTIYIEDNGKGLDTKINTEGIGMKLLKQNIEYLNGKVEITGKENSGTFVLAELPIIRPEPGKE